MSEKMKEEISAMMDDESSMFGVRRVLAEIESDDELHATWERYHFVKATLQQSNLCQTSILDRVWAELDNEQTAVPENLKISEQLADTSVKSKFNQYIGSMAVAATVAFMTVFGWQQYQGYQNPGLNNGMGFPVAELTGTALDNAPGSVKTLEEKPFLDAVDTLMLSDMPHAGIQTASSGSYTQGQAMARQSQINLPIPQVDVVTLEKLNLFLSNHAEHAALNTGRGILPFARTANYTQVEGVAK